MRSKETKRTLFNFLPYECAAAEEYLELMAEKGWMLQSINGAFLKFKKAEPQKIKYSVDVFHKVSVFDPKDSDLALEYREYCKAAGWDYVCQKGKIQVFYAEDCTRNISIHTDENEKFKSVFKASLYYVGSEFLLILLFIFNLYMQLFSGSVDYTLASNSGLLSIAAIFSIIFIYSIEVISFFVWVIKAGAKLKENKFMPYNNYKQLRIKNTFRNACGLIILLILFIFSIFDNQGSTGFIIFLLMVMCIPGIIMIYVKRFINRKRYSKNINRAIIISGTLISICLALMLTGILVGRSINVIGQSKVPAVKASLTLSDFGYKENDDASPYINFDKSILAQRTEYICDNKDNGLMYTIFQSQYSWVIKFDENRLLSSLNKYGIDLKQEDTNLPNDIKVYSDSNKRTFVLVSENRVVDIKKDFSGISDDEFLNKVYKKLF